MSEKRINDHIDLTFSSRPKEQLLVDNVYYEPILSGHPKHRSRFSFLGHDFAIPLWVSSMTGGAKRAANINKNLAKACEEFKLGMGLGSCRSLLESDQRWEDFDVRKFMPTRPLYTNFGIAQIEQLVQENKLAKIKEITERLNADGLIIHINPLQEWAQAEGDRYYEAPLVTIKKVLDRVSLPVIIKEVGQGFGPQSLAQLSYLPLAAIELAGYGGTNFTLLEQARLSGANSGKYSPKQSFGHIGHRVEEMINWLNQLDSSKMQCQNFIISGGIVDPLKGMFYKKQLKHNCVFGMASELLKYAMDDYEKLSAYLKEVDDCVQMAEVFLVKGDQNG